MVGVRSGVLACRAVIDWGSAARGDPAFDFAGVPLRAVPFMLEGYRRVSALDGDAPVEARILWRHLHLSLYVLGRGPLPGWSWAERPLPMLLDVLRFFVDAPGGAWARAQAALARPRERAPRAGCPDRRPTALGWPPADRRWSTSGDVPIGHSHCPRGQQIALLHSCWDRGI